MGIARHRWNTQVQNNELYPYSTLKKSGYKQTGARNIRHMDNEAGVVLSCYALPLLVLKSN